jgi:hypothetical protein
MHESGQRSAFKVDAADGGVATISTGDALLILWKSGANVPRIRWVTERAVAHIGERPRSIVALQLLLPSATPPGLREVSAVRSGLHVVGPHARRLVVVPLGDAAWQSVVRSVMRAGLAVIGQSERIKIANDPRHAFAQLTEVASESTPATDSLVTAVEALFAPLGEAPVGLRP